MLRCVVAESGILRASRPLVGTNFFKIVPPRGALFSSDVKPVQMSFNVFEGKNVERNSSPLIVMHGLFGSKQNWRSIAKSLTTKLNKRIYTVDARNHGDSPHVMEHNSDHIAADIAELMKQEGIPKACVMGHSMGGRAMMYMALKYPELVERGIILDISPISIPRDFGAMEDIFVAMKNISVSSDLPMSQGRKVVEDQIKRAVGNQDTVNFIMLNLRKRQTGEFYWAPNVESLHENLSLFSESMGNIANLPPYTKPIMFICGNRSNFVDPDSWPDIQKIFPNSDLHWLDAGHLVHYEQPAKFIDLVVNFLKTES